MTVRSNLSLRGIIGPMNVAVFKQPNVRLSQEEIENLKASVAAADPEGRVYLFGSRTDTARRGGDIDLLIVSKKIGRKDLTAIRWNFFERFGEQKLDIVLDDGTLAKPFVKKLFGKAVEL